MKWLKIMNEIEQSINAINENRIGLLIGQLEMSLYYGLWRQTFNPLSDVLYAQILDPLMSQLYERSVDL